METIVLHEGGQAVIYHYQNMFRSDIDGKHYCAPTKEILIRCISECHTAVIPETIPEPVQPLADILLRQLKTGTLEQKQSARKELLQLAAKGDEDAIGYLNFLPHFPLSLQAKYFAKSIGKDFEDVTFYDLSEHVTDLVLRASLMQELEHLFKVN